MKEGAEASKAIAASVPSSPRGQQDRLQANS